MNVLSSPYRYSGRLYHDFRRASDLRSTKRKLLHSEGLSDFEKWMLNRVSLTVHRSDRMYERGNAASYFEAGFSAIRCLQAALKAANGPEPQSILDFPCGYGRVLRFLRVAFPRASIWGAELPVAAVDFCRRVFGVEAFVSAPDVRQLTLAKSFDLIWCGSLLTHVDEPAALDILRFFHDHLTVGGLCVFTTHGRRPVELISHGQKNYLLDADSQERLLSGYRDRGYGYADYPNERGYGVSAVTRARVLETAASLGNWREVLFLENGWHAIQDVFAFQRLK